MAKQMKTRVHDPNNNSWCGGCCWGGGGGGGVWLWGGVGLGGGGVGWGLNPASLQEFDSKLGLMKKTNGNRDINR